VYSIVFILIYNKILNYIIILKFYIHIIIKIKKKKIKSIKFYLDVFNKN